VPLNATEFQKAPEVIFVNQDLAAFSVTAQTVMGNAAFLTPQIDERFRDAGYFGRIFDRDFFHRSNFPSRQPLLG
jgi:hypothetical protein